MKWGEVVSQGEVVWITLLEVLCIKSHQLHLYLCLYFWQPNRLLERCLQSAYSYSAHAHNEIPSITKICQDIQLFSHIKSDMSLFYLWLNYMSISRFFILIKFKFSLLYGKLLWHACNGFNSGLSYFKWLEGNLETKNKTAFIISFISSQKSKNLSKAVDLNC